MPGKDKSIRARLAQSKALEKVCLERSLAGGVGLLGAHATETEATDWSDRHRRSLAAERALRLSIDDKALKKAFSEFDLNPDNPFHWARLMRHLAYAVFGSNSHRGHPLVWTEEALENLLADIRLIETERPEFNLTQVWQELQRRGKLPDDFQYDAFRKRRKTALDLEEKLRREGLDLERFFPRPSGN